MIMLYDRGISMQETFPGKLVSKCNGAKCNYSARAVSPSHIVRHLCDDNMQISIIWTTEWLHAKPHNSKAEEKRIPTCSVQLLSFCNNWTNRGTMPTRMTSSMGGFGSTSQRKQQPILFVPGHSKPINRVILKDRSWQGVGDFPCNGFCLPKHFVCTHLKIRGLLVMRYTNWHTDIWHRHSFVDNFILMHTFTCHLFCNSVSPTPPPPAPKQFHTKNTLRALCASSWQMYT